MARSGEIINDMTVGSVPRKLLTFALPFMLSTLLQTAYGMVDMMVVGRVIGSSGLSAVSLSTRVMWMTTALCMGFTNAGQILIAQLVGAGKREDLQKTIGTLILTVFCAAAPLHLSTFSPPVRDRRVYSPALFGRGSPHSRRTSG